MGEVGSQTLGTFVIGENAVNTSVTAHSSVSQSTAETTGNALQKKLTLGNFSVSEKSIGTPLTKSPSEVTSPTATVNASSTSESITSESTTSQAESNLFIGEKTLGDKSLGTPLSSEASSTGGGIPTQSVTASRTVEPTLEVIIIADVSALATTSALGSTASTETVAGETLTVSFSGLTSDTDNVTTAGALFSNTALIPRLSPSVTKSTGGSIAGSATKITIANSISQAIDGLIANLSTVEKTGTGTTSTISNPEKSIASYDALISSTNNSVTAKAFESPLRAGIFTLGSKKFGDFLEVQSGVIGPLIAEGDSSITGVGKLSQSRTTGVLADSVSEGIAGTITPLTSEMFLADSQSNSTGGVIQTLFGKGNVGIPFTETDSDGDLSTLVSGTVLASTADTEAVDGETVSLLFSPFDGIVDSTATSESSVSAVESGVSLSESNSFTTANSVEALLSSFDISSTVKTTSISNSVKSLSAGLSLEVNPFTETIGFAPPPTIRVGSKTVGKFKLGKSSRANQNINSSSIRVDADATSESESKITPSSLSTLLSPSLSASSDGSTTKVRSTIFLSKSETVATSNSLVSSSVLNAVLPTVNTETSVEGQILQNVFSTSAGTADTSTVANIGKRIQSKLSNEKLGTFNLGETFGNKILRASSLASDSNAKATGNVIKFTSVFVSSIFSDSISQGVGGKKKSLESTVFDGNGKSSVTTKISPLETVVTPFAGDADTNTLAESTAQLLDVSPTIGERFLVDWALNQKILGDTIDEVRNWKLIEITLRMQKENVVERVRPLTPGVGAVDVISTSDGGYEVVKRGGSNEVTLEAATERKDVRPVKTWYLQNISEEVIGSEGQQYEVTIEALPVREKAFDNSLGNLTSPFPDETRTQGFWKYEFEKGSIVTRRVTTDIEREPTNELKSVTVSFLAEPEEVRVIEENLSKLNAVAERDVPDGTNIVEDSTSDKRHIVDVTPPQDARDTVEAGEYYVTEWETEYQQSRAYVVQMNLVENEN